MPNQRLRDSLLRNGFSFEQVAKATNVDPKTVERWITKNRTPYPRHRHAIASMVHETETYLWPDAVAAEAKKEINDSEVVQVYAHRHSVPQEVWTHLLDQTGMSISILVYAGMFLTDNPNLIKTMRRKAEEGVKIRIALGDPASREVARRSEEEGIGKGTLAAKVRNSLAFFKPLAESGHAEVRCHKTTLYNSIFRFDDEMLINTHVHGFMAAHAPMLHLRRLSGGDLFETYAESFQGVWDDAKPPKW
ncbi:helix-turn-helix transcriptional regulator [Actinosynnema pretiosum subsp. pretiosum]|uniref:Helix-turn-helix transcriptional regulator n=1 Tax=Actinosynnema pretiosum subsp. pretiosum TaxID=103721 RepID=A0AA45LD62_9PSEU|nr:helix-turn-helix transcriptional regulator [Actinosynnema pretiosum subsp. pretiosum]